MTSKRTIILMAILLVLLGAVVGPSLRDTFHAYAHADQATAAKPVAPLAAAPAVLPGMNSISNLGVQQQPDGRWMLSFDYFYTGAPKGATMQIYQIATGATSGPTPHDYMSETGPAKLGANRYTATIKNPRSGEMALTTQVYAVMSVVGNPRPQLARMDLEHRIHWPDPIVLEVEKAVADNRPEAIVQEAVKLIDSGEHHNLQRARSMLQALVERSPRLDSAYVELARVAMKTNWSAAGLSQAETLIRSALQISPESANAKILLGYVLAHQGRHRDAESLLVQAAASDPPNLWLWSNWGELLNMQGKTDAAIAKYRQAVSRPPSGDTNDRARQDAFANLLRLIGRRADLDAVEALHKQRSDDYPVAGCYGVEYARFLVLQRADAVRALALLRDRPPTGCAPERAREVQGLAHYVTWARADETAKAESLLRARALLAPSPSLFRSLASSAGTEPIARKLVASGDSVDVQDNRGYTALAYALRDGDATVAARLLRLGAKPLAEVGPDRMPAALIPVIARDFDTLRLLQKAGVDYTKLRFQGATAVEIARSLGDTKLAQALDPRAGGL